MSLKQESSLRDDDIPRVYWEQEFRRTKTIERGETWNPEKTIIGKSLGQFTSNSNLHGIDNDVDGGVCDDEDVADVGNDVLRHPESLVAGELSQAGDQLL